MFRCSALALAGLTSCAAPLVWQDVDPAADATAGPLDELVDEAPAEEPAAPKSPPRKAFGEGFYLGVRYGQSQIGGDFDGETALVGSQGLIVVPSFADGTGTGFAMGGGGEGSSVEIYFESFDHDGDFLGLQTDGELRSCGVRGRLGSPTDWSGGRIAPHLLLGFGFHELQIQDGSTDGVVVGDGTLNGLGLDYGFGVSVALHTRINLTVDYFWRCLDFTRGSGVRIDNVPLGDSLKTTDPIVMFGLDLVF